MAQSVAQHAAPDEAALVEATRGGDEAAFRRLYRLHATYAYRLALRITGGSDADAEEVLQESWLRAVRGLPRFEGRSSFRTWLCSIVTRTGLEVLRARERSLGDADPEAIEPRTTRDATTRVDLERMMAAMPTGYRTVLVLHDVEGFRHTEIAEIAGISVGTSKSQLTRARSWARRAMGHDYVGEG